MLSKMDMTTKQLMSSRIVWVALSSGDDTGDRLLLWRCWDCLLCLHRRATMYPLEKAMIPIKETSLKVSRVDKLCRRKKVMGMKEQDSVMYIKLSEVQLGVAAMEMKR